MILRHVKFAIVNSAICKLCFFPLWDQYCEILLFVQICGTLWINLVDIEGNSLLLDPYKVVFGLPNNPSYIAWVVQRFAKSSVSEEWS